MCTSVLDLSSASCSGRVGVDCVVCCGREQETKRLLYGNCLTLPKAEFFPRHAESGLVSMTFPRVYTPAEVQQPSDLDIRRDDEGALGHDGSQDAV